MVNLGNARVSIRLALYYEIVEGSFSTRLNVLFVDEGDPSKSSARPPRCNIRDR